MFSWATLLLHVVSARAAVIWGLQAMFHLGWNIQSDLLMCIDVDAGLGLFSRVPHGLGFSQCEIWVLKRSTPSVQRGKLKNALRSNLGSYTVTSTTFYLSKQVMRRPRFKGRRKKLQLSMGRMAKNLQASLIHHTLLSKGEKCAVTVFVKRELLYVYICTCIYIITHLKHI